MSAADSCSTPELRKSHWLLASWQADWPQTHPPSPVAATLVASLGSPPISRFFGWLVRSTQISGITFTASHRDTQTLTHAHTHTLTQRQPPSSALLGYLPWLLLLLTFLSDFFFSCFFLLVQFRRRRHVVAYFPIYEIICAKTILLGGENNKH